MPLKLSAMYDRGVIQRLLVIALLLPQLVFAQTVVDKAERTFLDTPTPARARRWLAELTEDPHVAGTPRRRSSPTTSSHGSRSSASTPR